MKIKLHIKRYGTVESVYFSQSLLAMSLTQEIVDALFEVGNKAESNQTRRDTEEMRQAIKCLKKALTHMQKVVK